MKNLLQFRNKSHEEVRQYILKTKGVDIVCNFNFGSLMLWVFVILAIVVGEYGVYKIIKQLQKRKDTSVGIGIK